MRADGIVDVRGGRVRLTERGAPLARIVASAFDQYLPRSRARHSVAV
jgi:oxygen-independent coproporphyrinogen-3 oxidase